MDTTFRRTDLAAAMSSAALAITLTSPVSAVMVGGDDTAWEAGFDGRISGGADVYPDMDRELAGAAALGTAAGALANDEEGHQVKRALCLSKAQNDLPGMSRLGMGLVGGSNWDTIAYALGDSAYVFPDYNAQISRTTPNMRGCEVEIGRLDPNVAQSRFSGATEASLAGATQTDSRFQGEASYITSFRQVRFPAFPRGSWRAAQNPSVDIENKVTSWSVSGGITFGWSGLGLTFSRYTGEALGSTLMFAEDALLDGIGRERERQGWLARASYDFDGQTRLRGSYGRLMADDIAAGRVDRGLAPLDEQKAWTVGFYHDVTSWLKLAAEYSNVEQRRLDDGKQDSDVFAIGGFLMW